MREALERAKALRWAGRPEDAAAELRVPLLHKDKPQLGTLTPRERDVLELLGWGRTNKEIAEELVLSVRTVGLHVPAKLGASNRSEAARIARDQT
ncbi:regulatory LuxR family protein [Lentzea atacamensis]|uniref:Regulatory LuxR family protein n=2 Tax=Lentzea TaxID=165301 RepID=A0A316I6Q6_9PSEU|nr:LuxR C-terminal-related transcriptional regulator [Lentzea atacamensis]PWK86105.1 regulatory LuxR family protein [Lentzea atacamensis]